MASASVLGAGKPTNQEDRTDPAESLVLAFTPTSAHPHPVRSTSTSAQTRDAPAPQSVSPPPPLGHTQDSTSREPVTPKPNPIASSRQHERGPRIAAERAGGGVASVRRRRGRGGGSVTATVRRACGFGDGSNEWRPAQARASGEPSAQPSRAWRRRRDEQLLAQLHRLCAKLHPRSSPFFPNLVFLFDFFSSLCKGSVDSVEPKNRTEKTEAELGGSWFCRTSIGS